MSGRVEVGTGRIPILHGPDGSIHSVPEEDLPVVLPEMEDFRPQTSDSPDDPPRPPLGRAPESWRHVIVNGVQYERELDTMPQWAGSCWYYLRFIEPWNSEGFVGKELEEFWMASGGVDLYVGGVEHAVLHPSMPASGTKCYSTWAMYRDPNPSAASSIRDIFRPTRIGMSAESSLTLRRSSTRTIVRPLTCRANREGVLPRECAGHAGVWQDGQKSEKCREPR